MRRITDPDGGCSNPSVRASLSPDQPCCTNCLRNGVGCGRWSHIAGSRGACCTSSTRSSARGESRATLTRERAARSVHRFAARTRHSAVSPRSSTDRAPSFYLGTVRVQVLPRAPSLQAQCVHVAQWTRAEASEASGCAFESRRGLHFDKQRVFNNGALWANGELAERQGTAVLTRRDLRVGQVRLLHSPPTPLKSFYF
jgi:hypothetical protein